MDNSSPSLGGKGFKFGGSCNPLAVLCRLQVVKQASSCGEVLRGSTLFVGVCRHVLYQMQVAGLVCQLLKAKVEPSL